MQIYEMPERHELAVGLHAYSFQNHFLYHPGFDAFSLIDRTIQYGLAGVNFSLNGQNFRSIGGTEPARLRAVGVAAKEAGLFIEADTCGTEFQHLSAMLLAASQLGADRLRTFARGPKKLDLRNRQDVETLIQTTIRDLQQIAPVAEDYGVTILLENHEEFSGDEIRRILDAVDHPYVAALYDFGNSMMVAEEPTHAAHVMGPYVKSVHFKDHVLIPSGTGGVRVAGVTCGQGNLDLVALLSELLKHTRLDRLAIENVYGYTAPVRRNHQLLDDLITSSPTFKIKENLGLLQFPGDLKAFAQDDLAQLLNLEEAAVAFSVAHARRVLAEVGFERLHNARGALFVREVVDVTDSATQLDSIAFAK